MVIENQSEIFGRATVRPRGQGAQRQQRIRQYLQHWYSSRALEGLREKAVCHARQIGVTPTGISVRNFKSRWGSCNKTGHVTFNWNIIKASHGITDYVVIHELCHLIHPNHSKDFWGLVGRHDGAYGEHKLWLKHQGASLLGTFGTCLSGTSTQRPHLIMCIPEAMLPTPGQRGW